MKILIIALSGIGNIILSTPLIKKLKENLKDVEIDFVVRSKVFGEPIKDSKYVNKVVVFPYDPYNKNIKSLFMGVKEIMKLRRQKYDYSITTFPSNQRMYNLFSFLVGAKKRITHKYQIGGIRTLSFLQNIRIPAKEEFSDPENNLNLLKSLNIKWDKKDLEKCFFHINKKNRIFAGEFIKEHKLQKYKLIGIHPGTSKRGAWRRWPVKYFVRLIKDLKENKKIGIIIFSGPDEEKTIQEIRENVNSERIFFIKDRELKNIAALIKKCDVFLSTDSALGHISGVFNINTIVLFGPANSKRTSPLGKKVKIIYKDVKCNPCLGYPFKSLKADYLKCKNYKKCLRQIKPEDVLEEIRKVL
ncbi:MAG: glycosyltransferase family 9 protein [Nanoarchaeota archaeon]|nr:glycosyltransferase family 9 protein [Nanoarchaeota archaeon]